MTDKVLFVVEPDSPIRLDQYLIAKLTLLDDFKGVTRSQVKIWIENGKVALNEKVILKAGSKLSIGDNISLQSQVIEPHELTPWDFKLNITYEDDELIVIDKPAGLTVHPGAGNKTNTLVNALVYHYGLDNLSNPDSFRPGIVHRLDRDTTGLIVIAKNIEVQNFLAQQFAKKTALRNYKALIRTLPRSVAEIDTKETGRIETLIGRHPSKRTLMSVLTESGRNAVTNWKIIERFYYGSIADIKLETGRTHQIRVHLNHIKTPVIGDKVYGDFSMLPKELLRVADKFGRQALHAYRLGFIHPKSNKLIEFNSPLPDDFEELVNVFRNFS